MSNLFRQVIAAFLSVSIFLISGIQHLMAQPESESPYSDQAFDPVENPAWYETPYLWVGLIVILIILLLVLRRKGNRPRTFMQPRDGE